MAVRCAFRVVDRPLSSASPDGASPNQYSIFSTSFTLSIGKVVGIQGDPRLDSAVIPRADVAKVCVAAIAEPAARNKTLEIIREDGEPVADWGGFFAALAADEN